MQEIRATQHETSQQMKMTGIRLDKLIASHERDDAKQYQI